MSHVLVIHAKGIDYSVLHGDDCPTEESYLGGHPGDGPLIDYCCNVGIEISHAGLDGLDVDWTTLDAGRYPLSFWSERHPAIPGLTSEEWSTGLVHEPKEGE